MMPTFLIIGAPKCGTSSLYHYLKDHPQVYMSPMKEAGFFAYSKGDFESPDSQQPDRHNPLWLKYAIRDMDSYQTLFEGATTEKVIGEASPFYLYWPGTAERIRQHIPDTRLIAILRDPAERAYSAFTHHVRYGEELETDFTEALKKEDPCSRDVWSGTFHYVLIGRYYEQLQRYYRVFDRSQIKVCLYDDLADDPVRLMQDIFRFLEVDDTFIPKVEVKHHVTTLPKNAIVHALLAKPNAVRKLLKPLVPVQLRKIAWYLRERNLSSPKPPLSPEVRKWLSTVYREDILKLQDLIQRDLSSWLK